MLRPSASSTYSSAKSMMRTQKLPAYCATPGSTTSRKATATKTSSLFFSRLSGTVGHPFAEQALRPHGEHEDQHDEGEDVLVVAAEHAAGQLADVAGAERFDQPQQHPAHHRPGEVADAAEHRRGERLQARQEAHRVLHRAV